MTSEFNPILMIETRHEETIDNAIVQAKMDVSYLTMFTQVNINDVITYWGL